MSLFNIFSISGSAIKAQAQKINLIASNLANLDSIVYKDGKYSPYISKKIIFELDSPNNSGIGGVKISGIIDDPNSIKMVYDPSHPLSDNRGYISKSNVNPTTEMIENISAVRSYQANIEVLKSAKYMIIKTLTICE